MSFKLRKYPSIPEPVAEPKSLQVSVIALKEGFELLSGQRNDPDRRAVTWDDLLRLGLIEQGDIPRT